MNHVHVHNIFSHFRQLVFDARILNTVPTTCHLPHFSMSNGIGHCQLFSIYILWIQLPIATNFIIYVFCLRVETGLHPCAQCSEISCHLSCKIDVYEPINSLIVFMHHEHRHSKNITFCCSVASEKGTN